MNRDYLEYLRCSEKIKIMAGISVTRAKTIRESLLDDSFQDTILAAVHCRLFDHWPLQEQRVFLEALEGLPEIEKRIRIHEMAYHLHKLDKLTANLA